MNKNTQSNYEADALADLIKERQPLNWLVEHWLEQGTLAVLVGPEGSFKSFLSIDWALSIATDSEWQGCRVSPGKVLYIAGEGRTGVIRRMRGWCDYYEAVPDDVFLGRRAVELVPSGDTERLTNYLKGDNWAFIIVDTLARNFGPGSENDAETMSAAIRNADRIREATGATVLLVHHAPLEGREEGKLRPRGSSALSGAADAIVTCSYDKASRVITVSSTKQKDAPSPDTCFLSFDVVDLGDRDNFGNTITTVVLRRTHVRPVSRKGPGKNQKRLVQELRSSANGDTEALIAIREVTDSFKLSRQARKNLEKWFNEQPWSKPSVGGHIVDMEKLPHV
jgi:hypothetical protein